LKISLQRWYIERDQVNDWILVDVKYKNEKHQEIARTILYVSGKGQWRVGDSGTLLKQGSRREGYRKKHYYDVPQ
jgi:Ser-tRNA(Ala) deacylase AlaX